MIGNFISIAIRNFIREPISTAINIAGLSVGLTSSILIFLWVSDEVSFNRFHKDFERIYAVMENQTYSDGEILTYDASPAPLAEKLKNNFSEIEIASHYSWPRQMLFSSGQKVIYNEGFFADTSFFKLYTFPVIEGDPNRLLPDQKSIVITKKMAEKFFPKQSALGKTLRVDNDLDATITGVVGEIPENSSIEFDFILRFEQYVQRSSKEFNWGQHSIYTCVKLREGIDVGSFSNKIKNVLVGTHAESNGIQLFLFPLKEWRLFWDFENGIPTGRGRITYIIGLSVSAFLILIAACINLMNLATAQATKRAKEVGIRKVAGASRTDLISQFLIESMMLAFVSLIIAIIGTELLLPLFNYLTSKKILLDYSDPYLISSLIAITIFSGLLAGSYPALLLSSFKPVAILKRTLFNSQNGIGIRRALVLIQFGLSVVLVMGAFTFNKQMQYMLTKDLGFDKKNLLYFQPRPGSLKNIETFKQELLQNPLIEYVGQGYDNPMNIENNDMAQWDGVPSNETETVQTTLCDADYIKAVGLKLLMGRHFIPGQASDSTNFIINETCANKMGFKNPLGHRLKVYKTEGRVIGVVNDFHHRDFQSSIAPVIFVLGESGVKPMTVFVRYKDGEIIKANQHLQKVYKKFEPTFPLEVSFLDKDMKGYLNNALAIGQLSIYLTAIIIFISCLGLFGLTLFSIERRTKEIGVRKVLGASILQLVTLLYRDFLKPVILSLAVALPMSNYLINQWLTRFAFHVNIEWWWFAIIAGLILCITLITISSQAIKAALGNPVDSLRSE